MGTIRTLARGFRALRLLFKILALALAFLAWQFLFTGEEELRPATDTASGPELELTNFGYPTSWVRRIRLEKEVALPGGLLSATLVAGFDENENGENSFPRDPDSTLVLSGITGGDATAGPAIYVLQTDRLRINALGCLAFSILLFLLVRIARSRFGQRRHERPARAHPRNYRPPIARP